MYNKKVCSKSNFISALPDLFNKSLTHQLFISILLSIHKAKNVLLPIQMITHEKNDHAFHRLTLNFTQTCKEDYFFKFRDLAPEIIESGPMCITDLFQNTLKSRAVDLSTIHYSFFEHFGGATNQDLLLAETCYYIVIYQIDHTIMHKRLHK